MIYVILGILVLILSFVIALVSLVYEQKKVEERKSEGEGFGQQDQESSRTPEIPAEPILEMPPQVSEELADGGLMPVSTVIPPADVSGAPSDSAAPMTGQLSGEAGEEGDVWWNKIKDSGEGLENTKEEREEAESIEAIKAELSRMILGRDKEEHVPEEQQKDPDEARIEDKKQRVLAGEFSLGDIKKTP